MWVIIIAVVVILVVALKSNKKNESNKSIDESELPNTLAELRKMRDKNWGNPIWYQCSKKICEVGMELYNEGKLVVDPSSEYDVKTLLEEMINVAEKSGEYTFIPCDNAVNYTCLHNASVIANDFVRRNSGKSVFPQNYSYVWPNLADYFTEGKVCKRDPDAARLNWRQHITYIQQAEAKIPDDGIKGLMEIPAGGDNGKDEIQKWIALQYGLGALKIAQGNAVYNRSAQTLQQCAELLFEMDLSRIGGDDVQTMLEEYEKGVAKENAYAQYKLGEFYLEGRYVDKNEAKGISYLERAADQGVYEAVNKLSCHYYTLANPYAGDHGDHTKSEIAEFERLYSKWSRRCDELLPKIADEFENRFKKYVPNAYNVVPPASVLEEEDTYSENSQDENAEESIFSVLDMPEIIYDADNNSYKRFDLSASSAVYMSEYQTITINDSDIKLGILGFSAENSYGYFHW